MFTEPYLQQLRDLRRRLHAAPELSGNERNTAVTIAQWLRGYNPDQLIEGIGGYGLAAVFEGRDAGPSIGFRCELDALPIQERNNFAHRSCNDGVAHKCGHDGHMTMVAGLAGLAGPDLSLRPQRGRLVLLFQPAEETGAGGPAFTADPAWARLNLDAVYALHNLPDRPMGSISCRPGVFCCASRGMTVKLTGRTAHAAAPETGLSPALPLCRMIEGLTHLPDAYDDAVTFCRVTVVGCKLGEAAFGTAPADAELWATLRTDNNGTMDQVVAAAEALVREAAEAVGLTYEISYTDVFQTTENHGPSAQAVLDAARDLGFAVQPMDEPLRFSEDFGAFTRKTNGAMFGLGSGPGPALHNDDYDFPDDLIPVGLGLFQRLAHQHLGWPMPTPSR